MKKLIILLAIFMLLGELEEIKYQTVTYGENIKQYAIVKVLQNGNAYAKPCEDCICYITLSDNKNTKYLNNKLMLKLNEGLYGYECSQKELPAGNYIFFANCTSALYTGGIAISDLNVKDNNFMLNAQTTPSNITSCIKYSQCKANFESLYLNCLPDGFSCMSDSITQSITDLIETIKNLIAIFDVTKFITTISTALTGYIALMLAPFLITGGLALTLIIMFLITLELIAIGYVLFSAKPQNGFEWVTKWLYAHVRIMNAIKDFIFRII